METLLDDSADGPLLTVRETAEVALGEGTKAGVKEKARLAAIRKAINAGVMS